MTTTDTRSNAAPDASASGVEPTQLIDEGTEYSKDYWDLVLEQLTRRALFRLGMWVLAALYGLAVFAPLIGNDRPYKLVAIDYGSYERSLGDLARLSEVVRLGANAQLDRAEEGKSLVAAPANAIRRGVETLELYLPDAQRSELDEFRGQLDALEAQVGAGDEGARSAGEALVGRAEELSETLEPSRSGGQVELIPVTSYPLPESLGGKSVFLIVLWLVGASFPFWNRIWNSVLLDGDRERIRRARRGKWAILLGLPAISVVLWSVVVGGGAPVFDVSPYKRGLSEGSIVAAEAPLLAPLSMGYAETHKEESYRPPTWISSSRLDSDGRYMVGDRVAKPDPITGYLPPATPVDVRFGEPWPNAPHRHLAGTDELGRDFFVRMLWGGRVSLAVGILSAALLTVIGVVVGALAGYFGGWVDTAIMRLIEILQSIPAFFLILAALAFIDPSESNLPPIIIIVIVIGLVRWTGTARLVRGEFLRLRDQEYVVAARALGFSNRRTIFKHVLPNAIGPVLVSAAFAVAAGILTESAVSFLGFGVQHPEASWGSLVNESRQAEHWWIQVFPGLLIFITVTCYNLVGDAVRDALDPKMKV